MASSIHLTKEAVLPVILAALKEDIGPRDLTCALLIPKTQTADAEIQVRQDGVIAGLQVAEWVFGQVDPKIKFKPTVRDGEVVHPGKVAAYLEGPAKGILAAERTALNFLSHLSGIATLTRRFVEKVKRSRAKILDTRKTTPSLRLLEKYAVCVGGGTAHRMGLFDQVLIKDNHLILMAARLSGGEPSAAAIERAVGEAKRRLQGKGIVEVEVKNLQEFRLALAAKADIVLLDNMALPDIQEAVRLRDAVTRSQKDGKPLLEVSGGVKLNNVEGIAASGVDRISIGALTHSAPALDISLEVLG